jgi:hypothetical protein
MIPMVDFSILFYLLCFLVFFLRQRRRFQNAVGTGEAEKFVHCLREVLVHRNVSQATEDLGMNATMRRDRGFLL